MDEAIRYGTSCHIFSPSPGGVAIPVCTVSCSSARTVYDRLRTTGPRVSVADCRRTQVQYEYLYHTLHHATFGIVRYGIIIMMPICHPASQPFVSHQTSQQIERSRRRSHQVLLLSYPYKYILPSSHPLQPLFTSSTHLPMSTHGCKTTPPTTLIRKPQPSETKSHLII